MADENVLTIPEQAARFGLTDELAESAARGRRAREDYTRSAEHDLAEQQQQNARDLAEQQQQNARDLAEQQQQFDLELQEYKFCLDQLKECPGANFRNVSLDSQSCWNELERCQESNRRKQQSSVGQQGNKQTMTSSIEDVIFEIISSDSFILYVVVSFLVILITIIAIQWFHKKK